MRDLAFIAFLAALLGLGLKRPFLFVLAYAYVDIVQPQRLSYYLLNSIPLSMIVFALAVLGWLVVDAKKGFSVAPRQWLMLMLVAWAGYTTANADFPVEAAEKWGWVWKAMVFAIFLPFTLRTKLRIEAMLLFMTLSAAAIVIAAGIKTAVTGGGYGAAIFMVDDNTGLYESSTVSMVAIALIPVILWLVRHNSVFPADWRVKLFAYALIFACLLIPIGTQARTGIVCIAVLVLLLLRDTKRRLLYLTLVAAAGAMTVPFLPKSFTSRMETIQTHQADESATTRVAVWSWTWEYAKEHPQGGGFAAYLGNRLTVETRKEASAGDVTSVQTASLEDKGRAYHSSYFEMLGEQGFPGLILFLLIHGISFFRMEAIRRRYRGVADGEEAWIGPLASALQVAHLIYLVGSLFIGVAFQPFIYMLLGVQIGLSQLVARRQRGSGTPFVRPVGQPPRPAEAI